MCYLHRWICLINVQHRNVMKTDNGWGHIRHMKREASYREWIREDVMRCGCQNHTRLMEPHLSTSWSLQPLPCLQPPAINNPFPVYNLQLPTAPFLSTTPRYQQPLHCLLPPTTNNPFPASNSLQARTPSLFRAPCYQQPLLCLQPRNTNDPFPVNNPCYQQLLPCLQPATTNNPFPIYNSLQATTPSLSTAPCIPDYNNLLATTPFPVYNLQLATTPFPVYNTLLATITSLSTTPDSRKVVFQHQADIFVMFTKRKVNIFIFPCP